MSLRSQADAVELLMGRARFLLEDERALLLEAVSTLKVLEKLQDALADKDLVTEQEYGELADDLARILRRS